MRKRASEATAASKFVRWTWITALSAGAILGTTFCAVDKGEIQHWQATERGPGKLRQVILHDKFAWPLRVEAVMSLIRTKPDHGDWIGLKYLIDGYKDEDDKLDGALTSSQLSQAARERILVQGDPESGTPGVVDQIVAGMAEKWPADSNVDPTLPYKDTATALLDRDLVSDEKSKDKLYDGLVKWLQDDFERRIDNPTEKYPTEKLLRLLKTIAVRKGIAAGKCQEGREAACPNPSLATVPTLFKEDARKLDKMVALVAEMGDVDTKNKARQALVDIAKRIESPEWLADYKKKIVEANTKDKVLDDAGAPENENNPHTLQRAKQRQGEELEVLLGFMANIAGGPIVDYCLDFAKATTKDAKLRAACLDVVKGAIAKTPDDPNATRTPADDAHFDTLLQIVEDPKNTEDDVRKGALSRLIEVPPKTEVTIRGKKASAKDQLMSRLYATWENIPDWHARYYEAQFLILGFVETKKDLQDFLDHLPKKSDAKMGRLEVIGYGQRIQTEMADKKPDGYPVNAITAKDGSVGAKLVAISGYIAQKKTDEATKALAVAAEDKAETPKCNNCDWTCWIDKSPVPTDPKVEKQEKKSIDTVGDFVKYCVNPTLK